MSGRQCAARPPPADTRNYNQGHAHPRKPMFTYHFFNRHNGVSRDRFASLNLSHHVGDLEENVERNRSRVKMHFGMDRLICAQQVHGDRVCRVDPSIENDSEIEKCDALVTDQRDTLLLIQQADCQAVLLHDPRGGAIGAVHCGWRGSVTGIIGKTIAEMQRYYRSTPADLAAFIGPSLGPCCGEFINYADELPRWMHQYQVRPSYFDFWEISRQQLLEAGLVENNIDIARECTCCSKDYFSYRRACRLENCVTGRHGSAICL